MPLWHLRCWPFVDTASEKCLLKRPVWRQELVFNCIALYWCHTPFKSNYTLNVIVIHNRLCTSNDTVKSRSMYCSFIQNHFRSLSYQTQPYLRYYTGDRVEKNRVEKVSQWIKSIVFFLWRYYTKIKLQSNFLNPSTIFKSMCEKF